MRMVAATRSVFLQGMIKADDLLRRVDGTVVEFGDDLVDAQPPIQRNTANSTGKKRKLKRAQYQAKFHTELRKRAKAEKQLSDVFENGFLATHQFIAIRSAQDNPSVPIEVRDALKQSFVSARSDAPTEIPECEVNEGRTHAKRR